MSSEESNPVVNQLKREINCLKTELIRYETLAKCYDKYFHYFDETNDSNEEIFKLKNKIKSLKEGKKSCIISVEKLDENQMNRNELEVDSRKFRQISTQTEIIETNRRLRAKEVFTQTEVNRSESNKIDETIALKSEQQNCVQFEAFIESIDDLNIYPNTLYLSQLIESSEGTPYEQAFKNEIRDKKEKDVRNESRIRIKNIRSLRTNRKHNSIRGQTEDNVIESNNNSDTDCDYNSNEEQMGNMSDSECGDDSRALIASSNGHKTRVPSKKRSYICSVEECYKRFASLSDLRVHEKTVHKIITKDIPYKYICEHIGCGKKFKTDGVFKTHLSEHSGNKYRCEWKDCNAVFTTEKYLNTHMIKHRGSYRCSHEGCPHSTVSSTHLKIHEMSHSEDRPLICLINDCNKRFKTNVCLKRHQLRSHPEDFDDIPWFECSLNDCDFRTKSKIVFKVHERQHTRPYVCDICQKTFARSEQLQDHLPTHSSELKVPCDWPGCDRVFSQRRQMNAHMNSHTLEISHSCHWPNCDKTFKTKGGLNVHINRHKGQNVFYCHSCDYVSPNKKRFVNHMTRKHSE